MQLRCGEAESVRVVMSVCIYAFVIITVITMTIADTSVIIAIVMLFNTVQQNNDYAGSNMQQHFCCTTDVSPKSVSHLCFRRPVQLVVGQDVFCYDLVCFCTLWIVHRQQDVKSAQQWARQQSLFSH